jgi:hypothetical protein
MLNVVVIVCTTKFNIKNSTLCPQSIKYTGWEEVDWINPVQSRNM